MMTLFEFFNKWRLNMLLTLYNKLSITISYDITCELKLELYIMHNMGRDDEGETKDADVMVH